MSEKWLYAGSLAAICVIGSVMFAASQNFVPDVTFKGSVLTGWHKLGDADWRADQGEIIGAPKHESGGWSGAEDLAPGFSKLAPSVPEATAPAPPKPAAAGGNGGGRGRGGRGGPALHADDWTAVQIILDADVLATSVNQGRGAGGTASDRMMGFGPLALYAGGSGEVRFKDVSYKDLNPKLEPKEGYLHTSACSA